VYHNSSQIRDLQGAERKARRRRTSAEAGRGALPLLRRRCTTGRATKQQPVASNS